MVAVGFIREGNETDLDLPRTCLVCSPNGSSPRRHRDAGGQSSHETSKGYLKEAIFLLKTLKKLIGWRVPFDLTVMHTYRGQVPAESADLVRCGTMASRFYSDAEVQLFRCLACAAAEQLSRSYRKGALTSERVWELEGHMQYALPGRKVSLARGKSIRDVTRMLEEMIGDDVKSVRSTLVQHLEETLSTLMKLSHRRLKAGVPKDTEERICALQHVLSESGHTAITEYLLGNAKKLLACVCDRGCFPVRKSSPTEEPAREERELHVSIPNLTISWRGRKAVDSPNPVKLFAAILRGRGGGVSAAELAKGYGCSAEAHSAGEKSNVEVTLSNFKKTLRKAKLHDLANAIKAIHGTGRYRFHFEHLCLSSCIVIEDDGSKNPITFSK